MDFGKKPAPAGAGAGDLIKDTTTATFMKDVIEASREAIVLVDFWAPWCEPCKQLTPALERVVRGYGGKVRLVKMNIDQNKQIAAQLRIQSIPTVYAFRDGRPLDMFQGALPESGLRQFIDRLVKEDSAGDIASVLAEAEAAFEAGDLQGAAEIFAAVLQEDRQNVQALAGLARCYLKSGDIARAEQTIALVPPDQRSVAPISGVQAAIDLAKRAASAGSTSELEAKVAANPADHQARIDLAMAHAAAGDKLGAVGQLIESIKRDKAWGEQAARKQLLQFFDAWGFKDPATVEGRRRLSSLLFS
ncbi:MAG TPA: thioredoxin [Hyphomicrobiaceae bacterium]|nr:thioredoxin [Hyphomicrobiaceae bacterium]